MSLLKQSIVMARLGFATLPERVWPSLIIVVTMACVVGVLLSMLSETAGLVQAYQAEGSSDGAIVLPAQIPSEYGNAFSQNDIATIASAPGIARNADGSVAADAEILFWVPPIEGYKIGSPELRGVGPAGFALRPNLKIVRGRSFRPGLKELIVGTRAERAFDLKLGDKVILPNGEWLIVGTFAAAGALLESQLMGDANTIMTMTGISGFGSVLMRLNDSKDFDGFRQWLTTNPTLAVSAERQSDYYLRTADRFTSFFTKLAYAVGFIMACGALFGAVKIMHTTVRNRTREIATLRAIGYRANSAAIAIVIEMIALALSGACLGTSSAWMIFDGKVMTGIETAFDLCVTPQMCVLGIGWALVLAVLGGLPPAVRAARIPVTEALRQV